jgi:hypothetical protein
MVNVEKIGSGLQFNVYDLGNGKVLKTFRTKFQMYLTNFLWEPYLIFSPWILIKRIKNAQKERGFSINYFEKNNQKNLLANLEFIKNKIFQDKVIPLKRLMGKSLDRDKIIIDKYANFIFDCWKQGFADKVYNFTKNNGVDKEGNIVLMDFGEITINRKDIERSIVSKRWKRAGCYRYRIHGKAKQYYSQKMKETLTLENLEKYFKKRKNKTA